MLLGTGWAVTALVACTLAVTAVRPAGERGRQRERPRGARMLRRRSDRVTLRRVERLLRTAGVAPAVAARVVRRAEARGYSARTLWRWATIHGCDRLVLVIGAGVGEAALLEHLRAGTEPDWGTLAIFADLAAADLPADLPADLSGGTPDGGLAGDDPARWPSASAFPVGPVGPDDWTVDDWTVDVAGLVADLDRLDGLDRSAPWPAVEEPEIRPSPADVDDVDRGPDGPRGRRFTA